MSGADASGADESGADESGADVSGAGVSSPLRIGRYRIVRRLGSGAFSTVWLGHDPEFDVDVAIKVLADNWAANDAIRKRFVAEARFLRRIRDRRVVHVYDIGTLDDDRPFFVMDYLDGGSLEDLRRSRVAPSEALRLCAEAARGLEVLHGHHLVHRDVTPGNLLLSRRANGWPAVVVADLGVARSVLHSSSGSMVVGTPSYMAPEQATSEPVDYRADVYALCAVAYALLTGRPPFRVEKVADLAARPASLEPPPLAEWLGAPDTLDGLFTSGLATDPHRRPPRAAILADAFEQLAAEVAGLPVRPAGIGGALPPHTRRESAPAVPVLMPAPPATPDQPNRTGRSPVFYLGMTGLAIVLFAVFLAIVIGLSL